MSEKTKKSKGYLQEALEITGDGDRERDYGHPVKNFTASGILWTVYLTVRGKLRPGEVITPNDFAVLEILLKVAREGNMHKADNFVDIAGYTNTVYRIVEKMGQEGWEPTLQEMFDVLVEEVENDRRKREEKS